MNHGPVCWRRRLAMCLAPLAAVLAFPGGAPAAAPDPTFRLSVPRSCAAGECQATVQYVNSLPTPVLLAVDWRHQGAPEVGFVPRSQAKCPPAGSCSATSPTYDAPGTYAVAVGVAGIDGSVAYSMQTLRVTGGPVGTGTGTGAGDLCAPVRSGEQCGPGNGRQTAGGGALVSHAGWPVVSGILWKVLDSGSHSKTGGPANDELLGHHGSDKIYGAGGKDILWGDWDPRANNTRQRDLLVGGAGSDFIYPSHGTNVVRAGAGADHIKAFYGHGSIDCGPGRDTAQVRMNGAYALHGCEHVVHFCQFGSTADGTCKQPGGGHARTARLRE